MISAFLLLLFIAAPALADKKACVESGEKLHEAQPAMADIQQAFKHCRENGYGKAQFYMATVYRYGNALTPRDVPRMMDMYEKAVAQGVPPAMQALVELYGAKDPVKAQYWKEQLERQRCCR